MAKMNETRINVEIGTCPACKATLEMVLRLELGDATVQKAPGDQMVVNFEFAQPAITGAVLKPHDCMGRDLVNPRPATRSVGSRTDFVDQTR